MKKFASNIIGSEILAFQEKVRLGKVSNLVISPDNGSLLGLVFEIKKTERIIPTNEIRSFGPSFIVVNDINSFAEADDIIRVKQALTLGANILNEKVETESGEKLGRVTDYTIELKKLSLDKLYVKPKISITFLSADLIISAKNIVEIRKDKIIVSDTYTKVKKTAINIAASPASD